MPIRIVDHATLSPREKVSLLTDFLLKSGFSIQSIAPNRELQTTDFTITRKSGISVLVHAIIKNISSGGWSWKPLVKRIQVKSYSSKNLPSQSKKEIVLLGGFALVDGDYVYAAWNIFAYMSQKTVRSCYIDAENLIKAHDEGFRKVFYADNHVYLSNNKSMEKLISLFIEQNATVN